MWKLLFLSFLLYSIYIYILFFLDDKACTFVGTAAYVPPEVLNSSPATFGQGLNYPRNTDEFCYDNIISYGSIMMQLSFEYSHLLLSKTTIVSCASFPSIQIFHFSLFFFFQNHGLFLTIHMLSLLMHRVSSFLLFHTRSLYNNFSSVFCFPPSNISQQK